MRFTDSIQVSFICSEHGTDLSDSFISAHELDFEADCNGSRVTTDAIEKMLEREEVESETAESEPDDDDSSYYLSCSPHDENPQHSSQLTFSSSGWLDAEASSASLSVHFDESRNVEYTNSTRTAEDCVESWYTEEDYEHFQNDARDIIHKFLSRYQEDRVATNQEPHDDHCFITMMEELYHVSLEADMLLHDANGTMDAQDKDFLYRLYKPFSSSCRLELIGLEHYVVESMAKDARCRRESLQDAVFERQFLVLLSTFKEFPPERNVRTWKIGTEEIISRTIVVAILHRIVLFTAHIAKIAQGRT